jgi:hypothetical protein
MRTYRTMTREQASELVRDYAAAIGREVGVDARATEIGVNSVACENDLGEFADDGRFYIHGVWQMPLPTEEQAATLVRLHDGWAAKGYRVTKFEMFSDDHGVVMAENPGDDVQLAVTSTVPPTAVAVVVLSACYLPG